MRFGLHLPNFGNCGYDLSSMRCHEKITSVLCQIQRYRKALHFEYAVFHPPEDNSVPEPFDYYVQNLRYVDVPLVLENIKTYDTDRFQGFYRCLKGELGDRLQGICLDVPHAHLAGENWVDFFHALGSEVKVVHLSDCREGVDFHYPFGIGGDLHLEEILKRLKRLGFDGVLNFEMLPPSPRHLDAYFETYLRAREFFHPEGMGEVRRRMAFIGRLGRWIGTFYR